MTTTGFCPFVRVGNSYIITVEVEPPDAELAPAGYPYLSQWDTPAEKISYGGLLYPANSNRTRGDCGPASLGSIIWGKTLHRPTVNEIGIACGQPASGNGSMYTNHGQLRAGAAAYGLTLRTRSPYIRPQLDMKLIRSELAEDRPVVALIKYDALRDALLDYSGVVRNQDKYNGTHWVSVVRMDETNVYVMDPDFWGEHREDGDHRLIPIPAFDEALRKVSESPFCSVPYQGLILGE